MVDVAGTASAGGAGGTGAGTVPFFCCWLSTRATTPAMMSAIKPRHIKAGASIRIGLKNEPLQEPCMDCPGMMPLPSHNRPEREPIIQPVPPHIKNNDSGASNHCQQDNANYYS